MQTMKKYYIGLLTVVMLFTCCGSRTMYQLEQLETRIDHVPDSVLSVLDSMESGFRTGEPRALHALLTVRAQDKCDLLIGNDSLITIATNYYGKRGNPERRLFAHFYAGRVYSAAGNSYMAIQFYTKALDFKDKVDNCYLLGLLYGDIAVNYSWVYDYNQAIENRKLSLHYYTLAGKEQHIINSKADLGLFYLNTNDYTEAEKFLLEVLEWCELNNNKNTLSFTLVNLFSLYEAINDMDRLSELYHRYPLETLEQNSRNYGIASFYYAKQNNVRKSNELLQKAWDLSETPTDTSFLWHRQYLLNKYQNNIDVALKSAEELAIYNDSVSKTSQLELILKSQRDYYQSELELSEIRNQVKRLIIIFVIVIVGVISLVLWYMYKSRMRAKEQKICDYLDSIDELRNKLSLQDEEIKQQIDTIREYSNMLADKDSEVKELKNALNEHGKKINLNLEDVEKKAVAVNILQKKISLLFSKECKVLNEVCRAYYENSSTQLNYKNLVKNFENVIYIFKSGDGYDALEEIVNEYMDNVMSLLRKEYNTFDKKDYKLACYWCANFSNKTISLITGMKTSTLRVYKGRIIKRIKESDKPSQELILSHIL